MRKLGVFMVAAVAGCTTSPPAPTTASAPTPAHAELKAAPGQTAYSDFTCYAGLPMTIRDASVFIGHLVVNPGCEIFLSNAIHAKSVEGQDPVKVSLSINALEMHGLTTLHLEDLDNKASDATGVPPEPKQADGKTVKGAAGAHGYAGGNGKPSITLNLTIGYFPAASDGSLWVRTDGQGAGNGGPGGKGGKGSAGKFTATSCPNGGDGGLGGKGGTGGTGSDTSPVVLRIAGNMQPAQAAAQRSAPSLAPPSVVPGTNNVVVASGAPGAGGVGGPGGTGGDPGEGHGKCGPFTGHANEGNGGEKGPAGDAGQGGKVVI